MEKTGYKETQLLRE